jgi:O-succinylbenzoate synthase
MAQAAGCQTAKVKVAERGQPLIEDAGRLEAVRAALGPTGKVRIDANGGWTVDEALHAVRELERFDLEYVEQPCASVDELADLRRRLRAGLQVPVAADESIRRTGSLSGGERKQRTSPCSLQLLGGVRPASRSRSESAYQLWCRVLETSVGIRAGLALAAALPELPYACGLNTVALLSDDLAKEPLIAVDGVIKVADLVVDQAALDRYQPSADIVRFWQARLVRTRELAGG